MATTIDGKGNEYLLTFTKPETTWIAELAKSMGITKEAIVGAAMNHGLTHYVESFCPKLEVPKIAVIATGKGTERNDKDAGQTT